MKFSLMFFAASESALGRDKYQLVVDSARFGDRAGFARVWVPERHFTAFGGLYPNPAVLHAALAMCTSTIGLNAGSVVAPLHHPLRLAEEWSVVDNLSNGRVGLSFASGWNPADFVLCPERYASRHERVVECMRTVQALWRGESYTGHSGTGEPCTVTIFPKPVQRELPVWMTVAGNPAHFARAGTSGAHLLTHLLDQDDEALATRIAIYREARAAAGFDPATGEVSVMIHTLVGADAAVVREQARRPYCDYIKANIGLFRGLAQSRGREADLSAMAPADLDEFVTFLYDRFAASRGLIGTPESCAAVVSRLERAGVTELACLLDFGPDADLILANLPHLARLKDLGSSPVARAPSPVAVTTRQAFDRARVRERCVQEISGDRWLELLARHGIRIDGAFRPATTIWRRDGEALGRLALDTATDAYRVHPASLDACSRMLAAALPGLEDDDTTAYVPSGLGACDVRAPLQGVVWVHAAITPAGASGSSIAGDVCIYDEDGRELAALRQIRLEPLHRAATTSPDVASLLYERVWQRAPPAPPERIDARGRWLVIADRGGVAVRLAGLLTEHGGECVAAADGGALRGVVYLRGLDAETAADADRDTLDHDVAHALRGALAIAQSSGSSPIWLATRGVAGGLRQDAAVRLAQSPLWGFARALAVERPGALGALVDLDPAAPPDAAAHQLLAVVAAERGGEELVAYDGGDRCVPRLQRIASAATQGPPIAFDAGGTVLITGGFGGLGIGVASWVASRGARHVTLCGRRAPGEAARAEIDRLRASGVDVVAIEADVADFAALSARLGVASSGRPALRAVFHLAGVLDDGWLEHQSWERFAAAFEAKIAGAWNLHRLTRESPLEHFVLFSSVASMVPARGQSSYAAANAFLDALAHHRRGLGLPALAVNWGPWSGAGHASTEYGRRAHEQLAALGIGSIAPGDGWRLLDTMMRRDQPQAAAVSVDWPTLFRADPAAARMGLLARMVAPTAAGRDDESRAASELLASLVALPADQRRPHLMECLSDMVIAALKLRTDEPLDGRQRLFDIGLDSIMALELKDRLERRLGVRLSATLLFVHPTLESLADFILAEFVVQAPRSVEPAAAIPALSEEALTLMLLREIDASRGA